MYKKHTCKTTRIPVGNVFLFWNFRPELTRELLVYRNWNVSRSWKLMFYESWYLVELMETILPKCWVMDWRLTDFLVSWLSVWSLHNIHPDITYHSINPWGLAKESCMVPQSCVLAWLGLKVSSRDSLLMFWVVNILRTMPDVSSKCNFAQWECWTSDTLLPLFKM